MYKGAGVVAVVLAGPKTHVQGVQGQVGAQRGRDLPAHDPAAEDIEDEGAVDPAGERPHIRNVGDPQPVRAVGGGGTVDQILPGVRGGPGNRRTRTLRARDPAQAKVFHQSRSRAASHRLAASQDLFTLQLRMHLPDPVDAVVLLVDSRDHGLEFLVAHSPRRGRSGPGGVESARSDRHISAGERRGDRLDSKHVLVPLDVVDDQRQGRSSSAAKKAEAVRKIAFARRSSLFSRSSSLTRTASPVVIPGR